MEIRQNIPVAPLREQLEKIVGMMNEKSSHVLGRSLLNQIPQVTNLKPGKYLYIRKEKEGSTDRYYMGFDVFGEDTLFIDFFDHLYYPRTIALFEDTNPEENG